MMREGQQQHITDKMVTATTTMASDDAISTDNDEDDDYCIRNLNPSIVEKLEAGAFRELCRHLQERSDSVQNMDLMTVSGFCRNCLAKVCCICMYVCVCMAAYRESLKKEFTACLV
jgi:hypothetical protein